MKTVSALCFLKKKKKERERKKCKQQQNYAPRPVGPRAHEKPKIK